MGRPNDPRANAGPLLRATSALHATLVLLLEAHGRASELRRAVSEFAVEIASLHATGLTNTQLRVLISDGLVEHWVEQTEPTNGSRRLVEVNNLSLPPNTCLGLTRRGIAYARARVGHLLVAEESPLPLWDGLRRQLRVGSSVVKRFLQPAPNQEVVLAAFEEEHWPPRIDDPLPPRNGLDPARMLHRTVGNLNRSQVNRLIQFGAGGDGRSFRWEWRFAREEGERG